MKASFLCKFFGLFLAGLAFFWIASGLGAFTSDVTQPPVAAPNGMVVSTQSLASDVGLEILKRGGHAVDAAVAVAFALAVVHPAAGNLGGGGFMLVHEASSGRDISIDFRETAPARSHRQMYLDEEDKPIEELSKVGHLASGVPGTVAGLHLAWREFGRLSWSDLLDPAVSLARDGFPVTDVLSQSLRNAEKLLTRFPESRRIFLRDGNFYGEGEILSQPELAWTLERIAADGPEAFYRGEVARQIVSEMEANGGFIALEDLAAYRAVVRQPVRGSYRGYEVVSMGPPSSGGVVLIQLLNMAEAYPFGRMGPGTVDSLHLMAEMMRRAFADRAAFLGDTDFVDVPVAQLTSKPYAYRNAKDIQKMRATPSSRVRPGDPYAREPEETTHLSVVDRDGNGVALTTTLNESYGSGVVVRGAGFLLNNEMDDFTVKPGAPNLYDLIQGEANSIEPGKRPLSAMTPTLVKREDRLYMVTGSPGGPTIINTVFQILLNVIDHGLDLQQAVDAPRIHHQWLPDRIVAERGRLDSRLEGGLRSRGHQVEYRDRIGDAHSILIDTGSGMRFGAADPRRGEAKAAGY